VPWYQCLTAHALIHAGGVYVVTQSAALALSELLAHWFIDFGKSSGLYGFNADQALHVACKVLWAVLISNVL
jgi:hypothetical protein